MSTKKSEYLVILIVMLVTVEIMYAANMIPGLSVTINRFDEFDTDQIGLEGVRFRSALVFDFVVEGVVDIQDYENYMCENHMFMRRICANDTSFYPCYSGLAYHLPYDTIQHTYFEQMDSSKIEIFEQFKIAVPFTSPYYDETTIFFFFDGYHWERTKNQPGVPPYFTIGKTFGSVGGAYDFNPSSWTGPGCVGFDYMSAYLGAEASDEITIIGEERPEQIDLGPLTFVGYTDSSWLPVPGDSIGLIFEFEEGDTAHIRYNICFISDFWGEYMNDSYADPYERPTTESGRCGEFFDLWVDTLADEDHRIEVVDTVGYCLDPANSNELSKKQFNTIFAYTKKPVHEDTLYIKCRDYGANALVWVGRPTKQGSYPNPDDPDFLNAEEDGDTAHFIPIPMDFDGYRQIGVFDDIQPNQAVGDGMADIWEQKQADWYNAHQPHGTPEITIREIWPVYKIDTLGGAFGDFTTEAELADVDEYCEGSGEYPGDGLNTFEEYRGFEVFDLDSGELIHVRTNPFLRDGFISAWPGQTRNDNGLGFSYPACVNLNGDTLIQMHMINLYGCVRGSYYRPVINHKYYGSHIPYLSIPNYGDEKAENPDKRGLLRWRETFAYELSYEFWKEPDSSVLGSTTGYACLDTTIDGIKIYKNGPETFRFIEINSKGIRNKIEGFFLKDEGSVYCNTLIDNLIKCIISHEIGHVYGIPHYMIGRQTLSELLMFKNSRNSVNLENIFQYNKGHMREGMYHATLDTSVMLYFPVSTKPGLARFLSSHLSNYGYYLPMTYSSYDSTWIMTNSRKPSLVP
jgi:hypothetical protein